MSKRVLMAVAMVGLAAADDVRADHQLGFHFRGTITHIEGTMAPPPHIQVGGPLSLQFAFVRATVDAEPGPGFGFYQGAIASGDAFASDYNRYCRVNDGSIWVIDNSALGDVYRAQMVSPADMMHAQVELIDAQSGAVTSDHLIENITLDDYDDEFDSKTITIEVGTPESYWRIVGDVEYFQVGFVGDPCDFNNDGVVNTQDFFDFLTSFFESNIRADYNDDGLVNSQDFFDFLICFLTHC